MSQEEEENDKLKIENELLKKELQPYREKKEKQNKKQELKELLKEIEKRKKWAKHDLKYNNTCKKPDVFRLV